MRRKIHTAGAALTAASILALMGVAGGGALIPGA